MSSSSSFDETFPFPSLNFADSSSSFNSVENNIPEDCFSLYGRPINEYFPINRCPFFTSHNTFIPQQKHLLSNFGYTGWIEDQIDLVVELCTHFPVSIELDIGFSKGIKEKSKDKRKIKIIDLISRNYINDTGNNFYIGHCIKKNNKKMIDNKINLATRKIPKIDFNTSNNTPSRPVLMGGSRKNRSTSILNLKKENPNNPNAQAGVSSSSGGGYRASYVGRKDFKGGHKNKEYEKILILKDLKTKKSNRKSRFKTKKVFYDNQKGGGLSDYWVGYDLIPIINKIISKYIYSKKKFENNNMSVYPLMILVDHNKKLLKDKDAKTKYINLWKNTIYPDIEHKLYILREELNSLKDNKHEEYALETKSINFVFSNLFVNIVRYIDFSYLGKSFEEYNELIKPGSGNIELKELLSYIEINKLDDLINNEIFKNLFDTLIYKFNTLTEEKLKYLNSIINKFIKENTTQFEDFDDFIGISDFKNTNFDAIEEKNFNIILKKIIILYKYFKKEETEDYNKNLLLEVLYKIIGNDNTTFFNNFSVDELTKDKIKSKINQLLTNPYSYKLSEIQEELNNIINKAYENMEERFEEQKKLFIIQNTNSFNNIMEEPLYKFFNKIIIRDKNLGYKYFITHIIPQLYSDITISNEFLLINQPLGDGLRNINRVALFENNSVSVMINNAKKKDKKIYNKINSPFSKIYPGGVFTYYETVDEFFKLLFIHLNIMHNDFDILKYYEKLNNIFLICTGKLEYKIQLKYFTSNITDVNPGNPGNSDSNLSGKVEINLGNSRIQESIIRKSIFENNILGVLREDSENTEYTFKNISKVDDVIEGMLKPARAMGSDPPPSEDNDTRKSLITLLTNSMADTVIKYEDSTYQHDVLLEYLKEDYEKNKKINTFEKLEVFPLYNRLAICPMIALNIDKYTQVIKDDNEPGSKPKTPPEDFKHVVQLAFIKHYFEEYLYNPKNKINIFLD